MSFNFDINHLKIYYKKYDSSSKWLKCIQKRNANNYLHEIKTPVISIIQKKIFTSFFS